jgi:hypothetical protein
MDVTLQQTPRFTDVVIEQIRVVALSFRREAAIAVMIVLGLGTVLIVGDVVSGRPGFDSDETFPTAWIAFFFPFAVWRGERRFGPSFLWTLPVNRRQLALARVFAGGVWLTAALALFVSWLVVMVLVSGGSPIAHLTRIPYVATMAMYLLGSAVVLGLRHPVRWLLGAGAVFFVLGLFSELSGSGPSDMDRFMSSSGLLSNIEAAAASWESLHSATRWAITTFLWLAAGLAALWAAASRHVESRRR